MTLAGWLQAGLFLLVVTLLVRPLGVYMARVFSGQPTFLDPVLRPVERAIYRLAGVDPGQEMDARHYTVAFLGFSVAGTLVLYTILRLQQFLPWFDAAHLTTPLTPDLAMNTAISFATTTTWQAYAGESTMSYFSQLAGLAAQNFLAGAGGLAVGVAFVRGFARQRTSRVGNFWVDVVRAILWVLLPLSLVGGIVLVWQGVPMNFSPYVDATGLEGGTQTIPQGPVAGLELIKNLGTNGGGFFNANGAHPYENPTPLTNLVEMLAIVLLPAAFTATFGRLIGRPRQGWMLYWVMVFLFVLGLWVSGWAEQGGNPVVARAAHVAVAAGPGQPGGNLEGKEVRFGIGASVLTAVVTSNTATGSVNAAPDSLTPVGGMVSLVNMLLGEIIFGGLGSGLYSIVMVALMGLFLTGLMVGRTPEYLGKKIGPPEVKLIMLYALLSPLAVLVLTATSVLAPGGLAGLTTNDGPHGFTSIAFAYSSSFANNGQAFGGLSADTPYYNVATAVAMLLGRFGLAIPALALAGRFARQPIRPVSLGTLPTDSLQFASVLVGTAIIVGGLTYFPALALGPVVEQLRLFAGALAGS